MFGPYASGNTGNSVDDLDDDDYERPEDVLEDNEPTDDDQNEDEPPAKKSSRDNLVDDAENASENKEPSTSGASQTVAARLDQYPPSKVLLFTVMNQNPDPAFIVDLNIINEICRRSGATVNKIVMVSKKLNGVQAMVEFDSIETATTAKGALHGKYVYSGCCLLKVEWGKSQSLNITTNNPVSWDYTKEAPEKEPSKHLPLLPNPKPIGGMAGQLFMAGQQSSRDNLVDDAENASENKEPSTSGASQTVAARHDQFPPSKVLVVRVMEGDPDLLCIVDMDDIHTICQRDGATVNKIVMMPRSHSVMALVEFDSIETATTVKGNLSGKYLFSIYSGAYSLHVDFAMSQSLSFATNNNVSWDFTKGARGNSVDDLDDDEDDYVWPDYFLKDSKPTNDDQNEDELPEKKSQSLNITTNNPVSWDYTKEAPEKEPSNHLPLLPNLKPIGGMAGQHFMAGQQVGTCGQVPPGQHLQCTRPAPGMHGQHSPMTHSGGKDDASSSSNLQQGSVLMVYGLNNKKMNCERMFNLFCLYGNVVRVKFLKSKDGVAMIQMGDNAACERAIKNLNGTFVFEQKLVIVYSTQDFIQDVLNPIQFEDGSISYKDFMGSKNNRFTTPETAVKNRIQPASKVLYFFNAPPELLEGVLIQTFSDLKVKLPKKIKMFPSKTQRSSTGLIEFENKADCVEALVAGNNSEIPNPNGKTGPYVLKLCFSDAPIED